MNVIVEALQERSMYREAKVPEMLPFITADWKMERYRHGTRYRWESRFFWEKCIHPTGDEKNDALHKDFVVRQAHREMSRAVYGKYARRLREVCQHMQRNSLNTRDEVETIMNMVSEMEGER
jgi:hypothetical protein